MPSDGPSSPTARPALVGATAAALVAGLALAWFATRIPSWGMRIPEADLTGSYLLGLALAAIALAVLSCLPHREKGWIELSWLLRAAIVLGPMLLYEYQYGLDAYRYFEVGADIFRPLSEEPAALGVTTVFAVVRALTGLGVGSYHALKVVFALAGLLGVWLFYRGSVRDRPEQDHRWLLAGLLFLPSLLFWPSILGKDPLNLLGLGIFWWGACSWVHRRAIGYLLIAVAGLWATWYIRPWMPLLGGVGLAAMAIVGARSAGHRFLGVVVSLGGAVAAGLWVLADLQVESLADLIKVTDITSKGWAIGGSAGEVPAFTSLWDMLLYLPVGAFTALFRPLPWEAHNLFALLASLENVLLLGLVVLAARHIRWSTLEDPVVVGALAFLAAWASFYAFISPQNLGTAVRFKAQALPLLLVLIARVSLSRPSILDEGEPGMHHQDP